MSSNPVVESLDTTTESLAPSHILPDGRYVYLPSATEQDHVRFFERSISRHGLLHAHLSQQQARKLGEEGVEGEGIMRQQDDEPAPKKKDEAKIHPLAMASAKLQANGINELNRAINLSQLVATGEYFGLTNIVDPSLEIAPTTDSSSEPKSLSGSAVAGASSASGVAVDTTAQGTAGVKAEVAMELQEEHRVRASFVLKRKRAQFERASSILGRHRRRLSEAIVAQTLPDDRLRELRAHWRLVAPEHGKRALPHAPRPTEVVACDIDVYWKGGTNGTNDVLGRLASRVPRYATIELAADYSVTKDVKAWEAINMPHPAGVHAEKISAAGPNNSVESDKMEVDDAKPFFSESSETRPVCTKAEPFAMADATLGRVDADFDPTKVTMLTLQFSIEKASTGFCQSMTLEPVLTISAQGKDANYLEDEKVLVALQHSLFCAKLFESIRRELAPDTEDVGQSGVAVKAQSVAWLSGESEENVLPPSSLMTGDSNSGLTMLCVTHCHEGEVKVQLDCEYHLRVDLVEAKPKPPTDDATMNSSTHNADSGSQTPRQLLMLCRALLLRAQETYHRHSVESEQRSGKATGQELNEIRSDSIETSPCVLQNCVSLGCKMLLERRIRKVLGKVNEWVKKAGNSSEGLKVEWLALSIFDLVSHFTVSFLSWSIDAQIVCDELTVTRFTERGHYRKAKFHSDGEFELYLKMALRRLF